VQSVGQRPPIQRQGHEANLPEEPVALCRKMGLIWSRCAAACAKKKPLRSGESERKREETRRGLQIVCYTDFGIMSTPF